MTTPPSTLTWEQLARDLNAPWSLHFDRDGTEYYGVICDVNGTELVASHLPGTAHGDRTFDTGTFWRPEGNEPTPRRIRQMQLMTAAPALLEALLALEAAAADPLGTLGELLAGDCGDRIRAAIAEAADPRAGRR